jgi:hypothetical protein
MIRSIETKEIKIERKKSIEQRRKSSYLGDSLLRTLDLVFWRAGRMALASRFCR